MSEKKPDKKPPAQPDKPISERLTDAEKSSKQEDKETSSDLQKAKDFLNRRR